MTSGSHNFYNKNSFLFVFIHDFILYLILWIFFKKKLLFINGPVHIKTYKNKQIA